MMKPSSLLWVIAFYGLSSLSALAQQAAKVREFDVDVLSFCQDQQEIDQKACAVVPPPTDATEQFKMLLPFLSGKSQSNQLKKQTCSMIQQLAKNNVKPVEVNLKDDQGNPWKIRFSFGYTRTNYRPTDVTIKSSKLNTTLKGFRFDERTSGEHYDPKTWKSAQDYFRWLDEPSNTFTFSIENKNNAIYLTAFHPKFLKTFYEMKDDKGNVSFVPASDKGYLSEGSDEMYSLIPEGQSAYEIKNTHQLMNYSVGYGRKFEIFDSPKGGRLVYVARVDAGLLVGADRTTNIDKAAGTWDQKTDKLGIQGETISLGQRLEYQRGKVGAFVEQKYTKADVEHSFMDGTATYDLDFSTLTFGVTVDVFTPNKKKK